MRTKNKKVRPESDYEIVRRYLKEEFWRLGELAGLCQQIVVPVEEVPELIEALKKTRKKFLHYYKDFYKERRYEEWKETMNKLVDETINVLEKKKEETKEVSK